MIRGKDDSTTIVISVGGSLIYPDQKNGLSEQFLSNLNEFVRRRLGENPDLRLVLVAGGGALARHFQEVVSRVLGHNLSNDNKDWLGINATRLNAQALRAIFEDVAEPRLIKHYEIILDTEKQVAIAAGWKPGWSTDYCAVRAARQYGAQSVINLSNIVQLCDKDPKKFPDAKPISSISWKKFRLMVGSVWIPGMNVPFDPIAAKEAERLKKTVVIMKGDNFANLDAYLDYKDFVGTVIS
ncbi:MAG: UMP kinase [bacterium]|nr:UMP kinase [bacterium]